MSVYVYQYNLKNIMLHHNSDLIFFKNSEMTTIKHLKCLLKVHLFISCNITWCDFSQKIIIHFLSNKCIVYHIRSNSYMFRSEKKKMYFTMNIIKHCGKMENKLQNR